MKRICLAMFAIALMANEVQAQGCVGYQAGQQQRRTLLPRGHAQANGCNGFQAGTQQFALVPVQRANGSCNGFQAGYQTFASNGCVGGVAGRQSFTPVQTATGVQMVPVNPAPTATAPAATAPAATATAPATTATAPAFTFVQTVEPPLAGSVVTGTAFTEEIVTVPRGRRAILPWNRR